MEREGVREREAARGDDLVTDDKIELRARAVRDLRGGIDCLDRRVRLAQEIDILLRRALPELRIVRLVPDFPLVDLALVPVDDRGDELLPPTDIGHASVLLPDLAGDV